MKFYYFIRYQATAVVFNGSIYGLQLFIYLNFSFKMFWRLMTLIDLNFFLKTKIWFDRQKVRRIR